MAGRDETAALSLLPSCFVDGENIPAPPHAWARPHLNAGTKTLPLQVRMCLVAPSDLCFSLEDLQAEGSSW